MSNLNRVFLMGNLTRDPQLKYLPSGTPVVEIGIAVNRSWTDQQSGERREETTFVDCKCMGRSAENIGKFFQKGRPIFIEGRLEYRSWEDKNGGGKRSKLEVFIENWQFVGSGRNEEGGERPGYAPSRGRADSDEEAPPRSAPPRRQEEPARTDFDEDEVPF